MVARSSAPSPGDHPAAITGVGSHHTPWFLERKLSRRNWADFAIVVLKVIAIRLASAIACFIAMLLAAWAGAFARAVSAYDWQVLRTLNSTTLLSASEQAGRYQGYLIPVLLVWALLLLFTPQGYTFAFRAATVAAGTLGYLHLSPPPSQLTNRLIALSNGVVTFDGHLDRYAIPVLLASIAGAYVLQASAASIFERLGYLRKAPGPGPQGQSARLALTLDAAGRLAGPALILLTLLAASWAATVIRLAAAPASPGIPGQSYGYQGGLYQGKFLIVLALMAICLSRTHDVDRWLPAVITLTVLYFLVPRTLSVPSFLEVPAGQGQLARIGAAWGANALWAALLVFTPAIGLGHYLTGRLPRPGQG
jgi:hypothetical protein